jgi:hypothetical protein
MRHVERHRQELKDKHKKAMGWAFMVCLVAVIVLLALWIIYDPSEGEFPCRQHHVTREVGPISIAGASDFHLERRR